MQKATDAKTETERGEVYEQISLATASGEMEYYSNGTDRLTAYKNALLNGVDGIDRDNLTDNGSNLITGTVTTKSGKQYDFSVPVPVTDITVAEHESVDRTGINVGDYVTYIPPKETVEIDGVETEQAKTYNLLSTYSGYTSDQTISQRYQTWRVLSVNSDGSIDLIPAFTESGIERIYFKGVLGYNNFVYLLNDMSDYLYSAPNINTKKSIVARSIKMEDITSRMIGGTENDTVDSSTGTSKVLKYQKDAVSDLTLSTFYGVSKNTENNTATYKNANYYPDIYQYQEGSGINIYSIDNDTYTGTILQNGASGVIGESDSFYSTPTTNNTRTEANTLTAKYTYFFGNIQSSDFKDEYSETYSLLSKTYFLASRYVKLNTDAVEYGFRIAGLASGKYQISGSPLITSSNGSSGNANQSILCPIITLNSGVEITLSSDSNSSTNTHSVVTE